MKYLTIEDVERNRVDTIPQYYILKYLKNNMNIYSFKVYLFSRDVIKVEDMYSDTMYFYYNSDYKSVFFTEDIEEAFKNDRNINRDA